MSTNRVAGHPDYSSSGTSAFIPEVWSSKLQKKYYTKTVLTAICNTDWEGEVKNQGDKVYIRGIPDITTFNHQKGMTLPTQRPEVADIEMLVDKGRGWNVLLDDVDKVQSDIDLLNKFTDDAAKQVDIAVDSALLGAVYADASAYNCGATAGKISSGYNLGASGSPIQITKTNIIDYVVDCEATLDEQDVPDDSRWIVLPSWAVAMLKKSDLKDASMTGDAKSILRSSTVGIIDRAVIYRSNNCGSVASGSEASGFKSYYALFGHRDAISFANQFVKTESLRSSTSFDTIIRGLMVYGYKVTKAEALGYMYIRK